MKNFLIILLMVIAVGYYFDISPTDFLPTVQNSGGAVKEGRSARGADQAPAAPAQPTPSSTPAANNADGSLANRWKP